jgi:hypothetical protein
LFFYRISAVKYDMFGATIVFAGSFYYNFRRRMRKACRIPVADCIPFPE